MESKTEVIRAQSAQNDTNVMDTEMITQNNPDEIHTSESTQVTLEEDTEEIPLENATPDVGQEPESFEDILKSPIKNQEMDNTTGKKAQ